MSIMCQVGERRDLDVCQTALPSKDMVYGYLGDRMLVEPFDATAYTEHLLKAHGIIIEVKPMPGSLAEYAATFAAIAKRPLDTSRLTTRQVRIDFAKAFAYRWLHDDLFRASCSHVPHLEFAVAIEATLKCYTTPSGETEYFDGDFGRWVVGGSHRVAGEDLSDPLIETSAPRELGWETVNGKLKLVPRAKSWDDSKFRNTTFMAPIGAQVKMLKPKHYADLDSNAAAAKIRNFANGMCLDFNLIPPTIDWSNDAAITTGLAVPTRRSLRTDRISRTTGIALVDYANPHRFAMARVIEASCRQPGAHTNDPGPGIPQIPIFSIST
jgi:hypothetical protein